MYKVLNCTSHGLFIDEYSPMLLPGETKTISNCLFDIQTFYAGCSYTNRCVIHSNKGEHSSYCYGNIFSTPQSGKDGITFILSERSNVDV